MTETIQSSVAEDFNWHLLYLWVEIPTSSSKIHCPSHYFYGYSNSWHETCSSIAEVQILNAQLSWVACVFPNLAVISSVLHKTNVDVSFNFCLIHVVEAIVGHETERCYLNERAVGFQLRQVPYIAIRTADVKLNVWFRRRSISRCVYEGYSCSVREWLPDVLP